MKSFLPKILIKNYYLFMRSKKKIFLISSIVICTITSIYVFGGYAAGHIVMNSLFGKRGEELNLESFEFKYLYKTRKEYSNLTNPVEFDIPSGKEKLKARLYEPNVTDEMFIVVHGLNGSSEGKISAFSSYLLDKNYNVLTVDLEAHGESSGDRLGGLHKGAYNLLDTIKYITKDDRLNKYKLNLLGYSLGGFSVAAVTNFDVTINKVISMGGFNSMMAEIEHSSISAIGQFAKAGIWSVEWACKDKYKDDLYLSAINGVRKNKDTKYLIIQDEHDDIVPRNASIYSFVKDNDTNVTRVLLKDRTHFSLFYSDAALEKEKILREYYKNNIENKGGLDRVSQEAKDEFSSLINKDISSELNKELTDTIDSFLD